MKLIVCLALVAFAAAVPFQKTVIIKPNHVEIIKEIPSKGLYFKFQSNPSENRPTTFNHQIYGKEGNIYQIAQYITYLFHQSQKLGYSPLQFAQYLSEHEYPEYVVKYLVEEYQNGFSKPYFQIPYELFQYYSTQEFSPEVQQYFLQNIESVYKQLQDFYPRYGFNAYEQKISGVPRPITEYTIEQAKYLSQYGLTYEQAQFVYEELIQAQKYAQNAMQFFVSEQLPSQVYQYVYKQLEQGLENIEKALHIYQTYGNKQQMYVPYYAAQYYIEQVHQAYQYFQNVYNYIQQQELVAQFPKYFVEQVKFAYLAAQKAYPQTYQQETYPEVARFGQAYPQELSSNYQETDDYYRQVIQYIQLVQKYIQSQEAFPESVYISEQLNRAFLSYRLAYQYYQQRYSTQPMVQQQVQQAYHYLNLAYLAAQKVGQGYLVQELQQALKYAQKLQMFESGYKYQSEYVSIQQLTQNILDEFRQYVAQGFVPQEYAYYIIEQLEQVLRNTYNVEHPNQHVVQQVYQYYQNILKYIQQEGRFSELISKYFFERIEKVFQLMKGYYQQSPEQYSPESSVQKYFGKSNQYQYGPYSQQYWQYLNNPTRQTFYQGESKMYPFQYQYGPYSQQYEQYVKNPFEYSFYKGEGQMFPYQYQYEQYSFPYQMYEQTFPSGEETRVSEKSTRTSRH